MMNKYNIKFHQKNPHYQRERYRKIRVSLLELMGNKCAKCGFSDVRALQVDHVNDDGYTERKKFGHNEYALKRVIQSYLNKEHKYQLLCANCNWIKKHDKTTK